MYEEMTYERLLREALARAPEGIDTRQGSIYYDAVAGAMFKIAKLYMDLGVIAPLSTLMTATGEMLDVRGAEYGMFRLKATPARYAAIIDGRYPRTGDRFYNDGAYFRVANYLDDTAICFEAEIAGSLQNGIYAGTPAVPVNHLSGLKSASFGALLEPGTDVETDESFRKRIYEKIGGPAENGNMQHYKTWCESIDGVGIARIIPLWNGVCTVMAVLIDPGGLPCGAEKVAQVQTYIDPADKGMTAEFGGKVYTVGDGLGNGVANIGAHFTAVGAEQIDINVRFAVELEEGANKAGVQELCREALKKYVKELVLGAKESRNITVRISSVGAIIAGISGVIDYSALTLNGAANNITVNQLGVPVIGEVVIA